MRERTHLAVSSLNLLDSDPILLNVGRLVPQKGHVYLLEAMVKIVKDLPHTKLLLVGDGPLLPTLTERRAQLGLDENIVFLGQRDDVKELLELADIFVFPSLYEGCPNALIEAMAMGKPCVAARIGPIAEVMEDRVSGVLVASQSPEEISKAIVDLSTSQRDDGLKMGRRAREIARQRFTVSAAVEKMEDLYHQVLDAHCASAVHAPTAAAGSK